MIYKIIVLLTSLLLVSCSIDWGNENKEKLILLEQRLEELESENKELKTSQEIELQKLEFEKEVYENERYDKYRLECQAIKEENEQALEDFINTCTGRGGNTIDFCMSSPAGQSLTKAVSSDFVGNCIESKQETSW